ALDPGEEETPHGGAAYSILRDGAPPPGSRAPHNLSRSRFRVLESRLCRNVERLRRLRTTAFDTVEPRTRVGLRLGGEVSLVARVEEDLPSERVDACVEAARLDAIDARLALRPLEIELEQDELQAVVEDHPLELEGIFGLRDAGELSKRREEIVER